MGSQASIKPCYSEEEKVQEQQAESNTEKKATKAIIYKNLFKPERALTSAADIDAQSKSAQMNVNKRFEVRKAYRQRRSVDSSSRNQGVTSKAAYKEAGAVLPQKVAQNSSWSRSNIDVIAGSKTSKCRTNNKDLKSNLEPELPRLILHGKNNPVNFIPTQEFGATPSPSVNTLKASLINESKCNLGTDSRQRGQSSLEYRELRKPVRKRAASAIRESPDIHGAQKSKTLRGFKTLKLEIRWQNKEQDFLLRNCYNYDGDNRVTLFRSPYTTVGKFEDSRTGKVLAVKQIHNADKYVEEIVNEVLILRYLNGIDRKHKYYPELYDAWHDERNDTVYLALEYFRYDLEQVLTKMRRRKVHFERKRLRYFMWKMVLSLDILHRANILHRDLKPQNILVLENLTGIRLIDYGSACCLRSTDRSLTQDRYTYGHIPMEVAAGRSYRYKADTFALGCIWWEMLHEGKRLIQFQGNLTSRRQQLSDNLRQLVQIFGRHQDKYEWILDEDMRRLARSTPTNKENPFAKLTDRTALEVLSGMLKLNPVERWNLSRVINHPYFARYKRAEPPLKISVPFSRPVTESKQDLWDILDLAFQEFQRKHSRIDAEIADASRKISMPERFQQFTI